METMMLQFRHKGPAPSLKEVGAMFDIKPEEIDSQFGVIATDPADGLYTVLVSESASERVHAALESRPKDPAEGLFSNPRIEPFGPPRETP